MAEGESEEAVRLRDMASEMRKSLRSIALPMTEKYMSSYSLSKSSAKMLDEDPKSSYFLTESLAEMMDEDPIRLQNQSCVIRKDTVQTSKGERFVYSSLARLPTFSIGLSSSRREKPPSASLRRSSVDPKAKSPARYFQMPELGARVFVGNVDGFDTVACHLLDEWLSASAFYPDDDFAVVRSIFKGDCHGELSGEIWEKFAEIYGSKHRLNVILNGTELSHNSSLNASSIMVGNVGGKSLRVSGSSSDSKNCVGDETIRQPSDVVEQPTVQHMGAGYWITNEGPGLLRLPKGSYLRKPEFMKLSDRLLESHESHALQLTRFDDFIIWGNQFLFNHVFGFDEVTDIVRKNASETADVIAAQIVKDAVKKLSQLVMGTLQSETLWMHTNVTAIVIVLDHKEILRKEKESIAPKDTAILSRLLGPKAISQSTILRDDKEIVESKEEEKITTLKEEEKVFASQMEDKKGIMMEEDDKVKIFVGDPLPNVPYIPIFALEENELASVEVQDNLETSSSTILFEVDDCKNKASCHITKWIIYGDAQERTLLCFFNVEENKYEFYFEDYESMATIIGLGVPHSKVVLKYGSPHVMVVEIPKEDWDVVKAHSNAIPLFIPKGNVLEQEIFPNILHYIANVLHNIVSMANDGGVRGNNGKGKSHSDANNGKGKGKVDDHDDRGNTSYANEGSNSTSDNNDNQKKEGKDGDDDEKDSWNQDGGKTSSDDKEVQAIVYLLFKSGGVLMEKGKKKKFQEVNKEEEEEKIKEVHRGVEKKKRNCLPILWQTMKRSENGNVVENQRESTTTSGIENDNDESLQKELKEQIHAEMVFTFTIKEHVGGQLKTIQATIGPITFALPTKNKKNYKQRGRFGWFHKKLEVAFGVVNPEVAYLDAKSYKVLDSSEVEESSSKCTSKGNSRTSTNAYKGKVGFKKVIIASGEYNRTNGLEAKTMDEVQNSCKTNRRVTKGDFFISDHTNLNSGQLRYSYHPRSPFKEREFEEEGEEDRLNMYHQNPICQLHQVSCEGTWCPYDSRNLEAYKLEASRKLGMTKIYNLKLEIEDEKKQKEGSRVKENLPLCFIQKLEKVVYLNHSMSHLNYSSCGEYYLRERVDPSKPSPFFTQGQSNEKPKWPKNDPFVDVKQERNI